MDVRQSKYMFGYLSLGALALTSACFHSENDDLKKEEVITRSLEKAKTVQSYSLENNFEYYIRPTMEFEEQSFVGKVIESPRTSYFEAREEYGREEEEIRKERYLGELYTTDGQTYLRSEEEGWVREEEVLGESIPAEYENEYDIPETLLGIFEGLDNVSMVEERNHYELFYKGDDQEIFEAFYMPVEYTEPGTFTDTINYKKREEGPPEVFLRIRKQDLTVEELEAKFYYEDADSYVETEIDYVWSFRFDDINEIDKIDVPDEVFEEAEQNE